MLSLSFILSFSKISSFEADKDLRYSTNVSCINLSKNPTLSGNYVTLQMAKWMHKEVIC